MAREYTEDELFEMSDEEIEAAFKEAKAALNEADEEGIEEDGNAEEDIQEDEGTEDELDADLEQPDEDSDDNDSEDSEDDDTTDDDSEEGDVEPDGDNDEPDAEQTEAVEEESKEEAQPVLDREKFYKEEKITVRANGRDTELTLEELVQLAPSMYGKANDYTKKMQAIKPWRKTIDAIEQAKLSHDDINLAIEVLKGNKDALTEVVKRAGVDTLDLDTEREGKYVPNDYGRDESALALKDVIDEISTDKEYETTYRIISKDWDDKSWQAMSKDPALVKRLHEEVQLGRFDTVQARADKLKMFDGGSKSDLEYYQIAVNQYLQEQVQEQNSNRAAEQARLEAEAKAKEEEQAKLDRAKQAQQKQKQTKAAAEKRKAAAPTKKAAGTKKVTDYLDADDDETYNEWYRKNVLKEG